MGQGESEVDHHTLTGGLGTIISTGQGQGNLLRVVRDPSENSFPGFIERFEGDKDVTYILGGIYNLIGYRREEGKLFYIIEKIAIQPAQFQLTGEGRGNKQTGQITDWGSYPRAPVTSTFYVKQFFNLNNIKPELPAVYEDWIPTDTPKSGPHPCAIIYQFDKTFLSVDFIDLDIYK